MQVMPLEQGEDGDSDLYNSVYQSLQKPERRRILFSLLEHNPQEALIVPEDVHIGEKDIETLNIALIHHHLPMLEEAGLIRWDRDASKLHKGHRFSKVANLIEAIKAEDPMVLLD